MKLKTFAAALAATIISGSAFAADLPSRKVAPVMAPVPVFTWTGFYVGVNIGYGFGGSNTITGSDVYLGNYPATVPGLNAAFNGNGGSKLNGILGGGQIGYNWQMGSLVAGIETDIQGAGLKSSNALGPIPGNPALGFIPFFTAGSGA